ncbi:hypothetical protein [Rubritalea tangerina]|uniref:hypothetical protein n=1 Tax=Rubritalea tangerina TaxID=430798 RepID=UPI0036192D61
MRLLYAFLVLLSLFFLLGFVVGWLQWTPHFKHSQFLEGVYSGTFFSVCSLIIDPILYFSWVSLQAKKKRSNQGL